MQAGWDGGGARIDQCHVEVLGGGAGGGASTRSFAPGMVVNAAGAYAADVLQLMAPHAATFPIAPRKRCVFNFRCEAAIDGAALNAPLVVLPSGVYFRPEGGRNSGRFICGVSPTEENDPDHVDGDVLEVTAADSLLFEEVIWPAMYEYVTWVGQEGRGERERKRERGRER